VSLAADREDHVRPRRRRRGSASGLRDEEAHRSPILTGAQPARGRRREPGRRKAARHLQRQAPLGGKGARDLLRHRGTGEQDDARGLDLVEQPLDGPEVLEHVEPEHDTLGDRQEIGNPDAAVNQRRAVLARRPPPGDQPAAQLGEDTRVVLVDLLVVEPDAHA
jgi:hypothetical protein